MSGNLWTEEQFNCPVCLDLPNEPVTIPCGHSYCMGCIKDYWSKDNPRSPGVYSCPQCRQTFCPKPSLSRNTMLAEAVEQLRKGALTTSARESIRSAHRANTMGRAKGGSRGGGVSRLPAMAVPCDMCHGAGDQRAAVKSCLVCMASYCEAHLKPHQTKAELKKHELIAPTGKLAQKICTEHKYLQEFYCRQCQMFVCWLCTSNQHKDHETTSTKAERTERQKELAEVQTENHQRLKEREGELKDMKKMLEATKRSADRVHDDTETVLSELQRSVERLQELVEGVMNQAGQEKVSEAQDVVDKLEAEISELKRRDKDMKEVFRCEDNIHFLEVGRLSLSGTFYIFLIHFRCMQLVDGHIGRGCQGVKDHIWDGTIVKKQHCPSHV
uniref:Tripartite motif containing 25, like n=1 Tax=Oncorhynchus kisutch TaxID=8019 RepID=A0A8C7K6H3_ONCKI